MVMVSAKCSDMCYTRNLKTGSEKDGYVPDWLGGGDYVEMTVCRHCGQIQGEWPELMPEMDQFKHGRAT